jgi:hypothetical protein
MYFLVIERVIKHNTHTTERFAARTANRESRHISGPFTARKTAERAAVMAMGTHPCLAVQVYSTEQLQSLLDDLDGRYMDSRGDEASRRDAIRSMLTRVEAVS